MLGGAKHSDGVTWKKCDGCLLGMLVADPCECVSKTKRWTGAAKHSGGVTWKTYDGCVVQEVDWRRQGLSDGSSLKGLWHAENSSHLGQGNLRPSQNRTPQPVQDNKARSQKLYC